MPPSHHPISVHLVTHNGAAWLPYCLESLARQTRQDFFLLVVDNSSADHSVRLVEEFLTSYPYLRARARVVRNKLNYGFARAHNQAMLWTDSAYVLVLNQDVVLGSTYLECVAQALEANPRLGAVTGKLLQWHMNRDTFHLGAFAEVAHGATLDSIGLQVQRSRRVTNLGQGEVDRGQYEGEREVFGVPATAPLYRREALRLVSPGGLVFDEHFVTYKEDVDLAWRLRLAEWDAWYAPQAVALHDRSLSGGERETRRQHVRNRRGWRPEHEVYSWVNHLGVLLKNDSAVNLIKDLPWFTWHELQKFVYLLLLKPHLLVRGVSRLMRLLPVCLRQRRLLRPTRKLSPTQLRHWWLRR